MAGSIFIRGSAVIGTGFFRLNLPAKLEVADEILVLSCLWKRWLFPKASISRLKHTSNWVSDGIAIEHSIRDYSSITFQCFYYDRLRSELEKRGYVVL